MSINKIKRKNDIPNFNDVVEAYYLSYFNEFITIGAFAEFYDLTIEQAKYLIKEGREINHSRGTDENSRS